MIRGGGGLIFVYVLKKRGGGFWGYQKGFSGEKVLLHGTATLQDRGQICGTTRKSLDEGGEKGGGKEQFGSTDRRKEWGPNTGGVQKKE